jgi:[FeFe] hydrogenase H-cluster maturation GTPase HydF
MLTAPRGVRLHIGIFGRRNAGKSSLLNALTRQNVSIVSEIAGTTTDPVEKPMELLPVGPVVFVDTAGVDDDSILGIQRVEKTRRVIDRVDLGLVVTAGIWDKFEQEIARALRLRGVPVIAVLNKSDQVTNTAELGARLDSDGVPWASTRADTGLGVDDLRTLILKAAPADFLEACGIIGDLIEPREVVVLVIPIDKEAPKGRIILPQVQTIRDLLDHDAISMVVKESELRIALERMSRPPSLVVTDSQAFLKVASETPPDILLTSFSILFSRYRGDLLTQVEGTLAVENLKPGDRILVAEACSHHPIGDDIGRVKIPHWLAKYIGGELSFTTVQGHDFPDDLSSYRLVIHCGACMINRREVLNRILWCGHAGVPITNYGLVIAYSLGIFERALGPFPAALALYHRLRDTRPRTTP